MQGFSWLHKPSSGGPETPRDPARRSTARFRPLLDVCERREMLSAVLTVTKSSDQIKPIEDLLAGSLSLFRITQASVSNLNLTDRPFGFQLQL